MIFRPYIPVRGSTFGNHGRKQAKTGNPTRSSTSYRPDEQEINLPLITHRMTHFPLITLPKAAAIVSKVALVQCPGVLLDVGGTVECIQSRVLDLECGSSVGTGGRWLSTSSLNTVNTVQASASNPTIRSSEIQPRNRVSLGDRQSKNCLRCSTIDLFRGHSLQVEPLRGEIEVGSSSGIKEMVTCSDQGHKRSGDFNSVIRKSVEKLARSGSQKRASIVENCKGTNSSRYALWRCTGVDLGASA
jgi:hypothetical protein